MAAQEGIILLVHLLPMLILEKIHFKEPISKFIDHIWVQNRPFMKTEFNYNENHVDSDQSEVMITT